MLISPKNNFYPNEDFYTLQSNLYEQHIIKVHHLEQKNNSKEIIQEFPKLIFDFYDFIFKNKIIFILIVIFFFKF